MLDDKRLPSYIRGMESKPKTIDAALAALVAGTITVEEIKASYERAAWSGYALRSSDPATIDAYWSVLEGWPKAQAVIRTASPAQIAAAMAQPSYRMTQREYDHEEE
jgi:hypothetical protein